jgi:hypothetical protein
MTVAKLTPDATERIIRRLIVANLSKCEEDPYWPRLFYGPWAFTFPGNANDTLQDAVNYFSQQIAKVEGLFDNNESQLSN